jgi:glycosyltransferase involved in cell wall biosynthesis
LIVKGEGTVVVHVISDAGPHPYFRTLIEAGGLERRGLMVGCVGGEGPLQDDMRELGIETFALGAASRRAFPSAVRRLAGLLRVRGAQIVQTHLVDGTLVGLAAARLARVPVGVMTAHHSHELPFHGRRLAWPDRLACGPLSDHIVAPSRQVAATLIKFAGAQPEKIEVVHHGFDLTRLDPAAVDGSSVRRELGLDHDLVLGAIGRIYELKNYPALLEAFALALGNVPDVRLVIAGPGDPSELARRAVELGIGDRVILPGPRHDIPQVLAAFDAFVHPAIAESFGMVIVEAMTMEKPVLSTPVGIAPEVIRSGSNGLLTRGVSCDALEVGICELLAARPQWQEIGTAARSAVQSFTATRMAARYAELYNRWLAGVAS